MLRAFPFLFLFLAASVFASPSFEFDIGEIKHHVTADRTLYHTNEKVYEAFGHVVISSKGERLSADYVWVDTLNNELKAKGNVIFVNQNSTIQAAEIQYNLISGMGQIFYGKVSNDSYTLHGQLIRRISQDRFLTSDGEYTTCKDCPESWSFAARDMDVTFDGYAFMNDVYLKVKDIPTVYVPYLVVPVKTRRQSGFIFPRMGGGSNHGFTYIQPFFIAIDRSQDATIAVGKYAAQGSRYEGQYRYKFDSQVDGELNYYRTNDTHYQYSTSNSTNRYALKGDNEWNFAKFANIHWRLNEVSDQQYIFDFPEDINGLYLPNLESNFSWNASFDDFFITTQANRYRNLLYTYPTGFDGGTVQDTPSVFFGLKDQKISGPLLLNFNGRFDNFVRHNGAFQDVAGNGVYDSTQDTVREAKRFLLAPELSMPLKVGQSFSLVPSVQYNANYYTFPMPANSHLSDTSIRYLLTKVEASTVIERVYDYNGTQVNRIQHQLQPTLTYSYIPWINQDSNHPFSKQLLQSGGAFDEYDIVPVSNSSDYLRIPEGNSIQYGLHSRLIRHMRNTDETMKAYPYDTWVKKDKQYPTPENKKEELQIERDRAWDKYGPNYSEYQDIWDVSVAQAFDFKEIHQSSETTSPFSFLLARSDLNVDDLSNTLEYKYYPRVLLSPAYPATVGQQLSNRYTFSTSSTWYINKMANIHGTRSFVRSLSLSYSDSTLGSASRGIGGSVYWSFNDYFAIGYSKSLDLISHNQLNQLVRAVFSSPSECWALGVHYSEDINTGTYFGIDIGVNLFGTGYVGVNKMGGSGASNFTGSGVLPGTGM